MWPLLCSWEEMPIEAGILDKAHSQTNQDLRDVGTVRKEKWIFHVGIFFSHRKKDSRNACCSSKLPGVCDSCLILSWEHGIHPYENRLLWSHVMSSPQVIIQSLDIAFWRKTDAHKGLPHDMKNGWTELLQALEIVEKQLRWPASKQRRLMLSPLAGVVWAVCA